MFVRQVTMKLTATSAAEFTRLIEEEVLPLLRRQPGFRDEIISLAPACAEAVCTSFWNTEAEAEAYARAVYPEVLKALSRVVEGVPRVGTFELSSSTLHRVIARAA